MPPKRRLSYEEESVKIQVLMDEGYSLAAISDKVKCSGSCVSKTVKETIAYRAAQTSMIRMGKQRKDWTLHEWQSIIWSD